MRKHLDQCKNPIRINDVLIEKQELDQWIDALRKNEEQFTGMLLRSEHEMVEILQYWAKTQEQAFENCFGAKIKIHKRFTSSFGYPVIYPAVIDFSGER